MSKNINYLDDIAIFFKSSSLPIATPPPSATLISQFSATLIFIPMNGEPQITVGAPGKEEIKNKIAELMK